MTCSCSEREMQNEERGYTEFIVQPTKGGLQKRVKYIGGGLEFIPQLTYATIVPTRYVDMRGFDMSCWLHNPKIWDAVKFQLRIEVKSGNNWVLWERELTEGKYGVGFKNIIYDLGQVLPVVSLRFEAYVTREEAIDNYEFFVWRSHRVRLYALEPPATIDPPQL